MAEVKSVEIKTCPGCAGKVSTDCPLCWGVGKIPKDRCACARPAVFQDEDTGEMFCGLRICLGRPKARQERLMTQARLGDRKPPPTQLEQAFSQEEEDYMAEFGMGSHMGHIGHSHSRYRN